MSCPISVCIIAKNEEKHIEKCLKSIRSHATETVPIEIVVVDTGSTDRTKEIASAYADKVLDFKWINDFSAARNYSIEQAAHDYVLVLDCDEVIIRLDSEQLKTAIETHPKAIGQLYDRQSLSLQSD